ncbi:uncharacterized protein LOC117649902 [Thrips palmi]|uniref:Uncharacterized protein LOC117649902 n=1 Tax=Thrips palmi TaxID=161013 RepID=A0A6P8ZUK2_THRPL|nr:uncharacterized protein LOC117649902 [Thrips palmi]
MFRNRIKCNMCHFKSLSQAQLMNHYVRTHRYDPHFNVTCASEGCRATYSNWDSFKKHMKRKHRGAAHEDPIQNADINLGDNGDLGDQIQIDNRPDDAPEYVQELIGLDQVQWHAVKFLLMIRDKYRTSNVAMLKVLSGSEHLIQEYASFILSQIQEAANPNTNLIHVNRVQELLEEFPASSVFSHVSTKTMLDSFLVSSLGMIMPKMVKVGKGWRWKRKPTTKLVRTIHCAYSIPFLQCLKRLLQNPQVRSCVDNPKLSRDALKTILDGLYYKNSAIFSQHVNSLAIIFYYDEMEVDNPLGSKSHKLGMFYWVLANIYPEYRSTLQAHNLLMVAKYCHIVKYGIKKILAEFIEDIKVLETEGITITVNNVEKNYKGSVIFAAADTPAAALLGGFKKSVTKTIRMCRRCHTDQDRWRMYFREEYFHLRDVVSHTDHVAAVEDRTVTKATKLFWSRHYGINEGSVFMGLAAFDVTKCFPQDIMHVIAEGVLEVEMRVFLKFLCGNHFISLDILNRKLQHFDYGHLHRDKPSDIHSDHLDNSLRQSAAQMLCLAYVLPFVLGDLKCDDNNLQIEAKERLLCHTKLLQITTMCYAFVIPRAQLHLLAFAIESFMSNFKALYPEQMG